MAIEQKMIILPALDRGFHLITSQIEDALDSFSTIKNGVVHLFIQHTSASLSINENVDPSVRKDMEHFFTEIADEKSYYLHTFEGPDDMPAHIKASLLGNSLTIPMTNGRMNLGTWQGIYLGEHRDFTSARTIVITVNGE